MKLCISSPTCIYPYAFELFGNGTYELSKISIPEPPDDTFLPVFSRGRFTIVVFA